jgi:quercetin dioxygenase-like cupin family protein
MKVERHQMSELRPYKRSPALSNSSWYKGMLFSQMAGAVDNGGAFDVTISTMRRGTEPPPHVHSREDEFFHVFSGEMRAYVGGQVLSLSTGECIFLPRQTPHARLIVSEEIHVIAFIVRGGINDAFNKMSAPAERLEVSSDADIVTYATADLTETIKVWEQHGLRFLNPDEIRAYMPEYPL